MKRCRRTAIVRSFLQSVVLTVSLTACLAGPLQTASGASISGLYVFGDSLSDPGNNAILFGSTASPPFNVTLQSDITSNSFIPTYPYAASLQYSNGDV